MGDKLYITNKTGRNMLAAISDTYTGSNLIICELHPGNNELNIANLTNGNYVFYLEDENHHIIYSQQITKAN